STSRLISELSPIRYASITRGEVSSSATVSVGSWSRPGRNSSGATSWSPSYIGSGKCGPVATGASGSARVQVSAGAATAVLVLSSTVTSGRSSSRIRTCSEPVDSAGRAAAATTGAAPATTIPTGAGGAGARASCSAA